MNNINWLTYQYDKSDKWYDLHKRLRDDYVLWMRAIFYLDVMEFLKYQKPKELMRETFRAKCEEIYDTHKEIYDMLEITYKDLYDDKQLYEILEAWNDLPNDDDEDE